ncbi:MAG TPA: hypothetical protein VFL59_08200 [Candidatus Nanopelagicales bacterium]|nr:hypothetical protein [Candidatus Nanopelagicales bacterium]
MRPAHRLRQIVNAVNLATPLGLAAAKAQRGRLERGPDGLVIGRDATGRFPVAAAYTVGNVVVVRPGVELTDDLLAHEGAHATQWACCVVLFLPLYAAAMGWSWLRTGDHWSRNVFERRAGLAAGGYVENPVRRRRQAG